MTLNITGAQHNNALHYAECCVLSIVLISVVMLSVVMVSVVMLSVVMLIVVMLTDSVCLINLSNLLHKQKQRILFEDHFSMTEPVIEVEYGMLQNILELTFK